MSRAEGGAGQAGRLSDTPVRHPRGFVAHWRTFSARISGAGARLRERFHPQDGGVRRSSWAWFRDFNARHPVASRSRFRSPSWTNRGAGDRAFSIGPMVFAGIIFVSLAIALGTVLIRATSDTTGSRAEGQDNSAALSSLGSGTSAEPSSGASVPEDRLPGVDLHVNEAAGYLFTYPSSWQVAHEAGVDRLRHPSGDVVMTFELAPPGTLRSASDRTVREITNQLSDVELDTSPIERTPQGLPSLVVGGQGVNSRGETMRFIVITIEDPEGNREITVHFSPEAQPLEALPDIREIIASYRLSTPV